MTWPTFSVEGKRVTVAGAARSGIAAAELLVAARRAGDAVRHRDATCRRPRRSRTSASRSSSGGHRDATFTGADLIVLEPGRAARTAGRRGGARARRAGDRRGRARVALAARPGHRDHRDEGQVDDDRADGPDARGGGLPGDRRRQHRRAAERAGRRTRRPRRCTSSRRAAFSSSRSRRSTRGSR